MKDRFRILRHKNRKALRQKCLNRISIICLENKYCLREVLSHRREHRIVDQRQVIIKLLRLDGYSFTLIGEAMDRDHSSIIHLAKYRDRNNEI